jgi:D-threonate/D-erythronate kinase
VIVIGLIADDLTGACDSALPFLGEGPVRVGIWPHVPDGELACAAVTTESRAEAATVSYERSHEAATALHCDLLYRKLDSLLRGHPVEDVAGVLAAVGVTHCVVSPALPAEGRITAAGIQRWPGGEVDLSALFAPLVGRVDLRDAATDADLDQVARDLLDRGDRVMAGTAGLAAALARVMGMAPPAPAPPPGCVRPLAVVGSPAAAGQAEYARVRGWDVQVLGPPSLPDLDGYDGLLLTGGETAARVLTAVGAQGLLLLGEALPRAPMARVCGGHLDGLPVVLKAGAFGPENAIHRALEALHAAPS